MSVKITSHYRTKRMTPKEVNTLWASPSQDLLSRKGRKYLDNQILAIRRILNEMDSIGIDMSDNVHEALDDIEMEYLCDPEGE